MAIALFVGCTSQKAERTQSNEREEQQEAYTPVETAQVVRKTLTNTTMISGKVSADKNVMVLPEIPGTVKSIAVKEGDQVKKGDVLLRWTRETFKNR